MGGVLRAQAESLDWTDVSSSNVGAVAYAPDFARLFVRFLNGSLYAYEAVSPETHAAFLAAPSKGRWVWDVLRAGGYAYTLVK